MSNKKRVNKRRRRSPWYKMFAKTETRLSARVTKEEDWQTDVPNIRLSRAFVVVLVMHFVVIGALTAFTVVNSDDDKEQPEKTAEKKSSKDPLVADAGKEEVKAGSTEKKDSSYRKSVQDMYKTDDMRRHIVHSGDTVDKIAGQYNVKPEDIYAVNRINELYQLYQGRVIRIPVSPSEPLRSKPGPVESIDPSANTNMVNTDDDKRTTSAVPASEVVNSTDTAKDIGTPPAEEEPVVEQADRSEQEVADRDDRERTSADDIVKPDDLDRRKEVAPPVPTQKVYVVKAGDNAYRIAKRHGMKYQDLLRHNGLSESAPLGIGQKLKIPN